MLFRQLFDHDTYTFTYLLADAQGQAVLIDPVLEKLPLYEMLLKQYGLTLTTAMDTHVHADHITALGALRDEFQCVTILGEKTQADCVSKKVSDKEIVEVGELKIQAIATPGHTDDSYSYYLSPEQGGMVFTGDTLLIRGTGRTDFQNGDANDQYHSLFDKLLCLPEDTLVYPAHDYKGMNVSTISEEKRFNPRLQVANEQEYVELMGNLNLPNPKYMDVAVPANLKCGKEVN